MELAKDLRSRHEVRELVDNAVKAQACLCAMDQKAIDAMVCAMAEAIIIANSVCTNNVK